MVVGIVGCTVKNSLTLVFVSGTDLDYWFCWGCLPLGCCSWRVGLEVRFVESLWDMRRFVVGYILLEPVEVNSFVDIAGFIIVVNVVPTEPVLCWGGSEGRLGKKW